MFTMTYGGFRKTACLAALLLAAGLCPLAAAEVRAPVFAGRFYPSARSDLERMIAKLAADAAQTPDPAGERI